MWLFEAVSCEWELIIIKHQTLWIEFKGHFYFFLLGKNEPTEKKSSRLLVSKTKR